VVAGFQVEGLDVKHGNKLHVWLELSVTKVLRCTWAAELYIIIMILERDAECVERRWRGIVGLQDIVPASASISSTITS
jgi:hypothetical protein